METVTFKEVHEELEKESLFLFEDHDTKGFTEKATLLNDIGFNNSIATKLYGSIVSNQRNIKEYGRKYKGLYKFILKPQLERICEKYNLYVRQPEDFLGDIPEKNITDMSNFSVYLTDLIDPEILMTMSSTSWDNWVKWYEHHMDWEHDPMFIGKKDYKIPIGNLKNIVEFTDTIKIAAVESLFSKRAFEQSRDRIINKPQLEAKNMVELDPIVLCETQHGYIIITAWGDEANDELVVNQNNN